MNTHNHTIIVPQFGPFVIHGTECEARDWAKLIISRRKCGMVIIRKQSQLA